MIAAKIILVVEDEESIRSPLVAALKYRGFDAVGAPNVSEARRLIVKMEHHIDVAVLDMSLEDQYYPSITGTDVGMEILNINPKWPPEFLIFSGHTPPDYYNAAFRLQAAAYIVKGTLTQDDLIRHIRSLALRRAFNLHREDIVEKIENIAATSHTPNVAVAEVCRQVLEPETQACLGLPYVFLLSDGKGTQNCGSDAGLPSGYDPAYEQIQALVFGAVNESDPIVFQPELLSRTADAKTPKIYEKLVGSVFLRLFAIYDLRLSIGILRADDEDLSLPEDPVKLARTLSSYLHPTVVGHLFSVLFQLSAINAKRDAERRTLLEHTSRFCLYVGQTQLDVLNEGIETKEIDPESQYFQKLKRLALDLRATGNEFSQLSDISPTSESSERKLPAVAIADVVEQAWYEVKEQFPVGEFALQSTGQPFDLGIERNDLLVVVLRILQWMVQRQDKIPGDMAPEIQIAYSRQEGRGEISFTDRSRRLSNPLRKKLFEPFTQATTSPSAILEEGEDRPGLYLPLYLAKMLVEVKNDGLLEDKSDELEGKIGHRFVISFPFAEQ
jgi:DNA-binding NarL/FixJ family response regulator